MGALEKDRGRPRAGDGVKNNGLRPTFHTMPTNLRHVYWVWGAMIQRCHNPKNRGFKRYGARGITVCDRWRTSFDAFFADMGIPPEGDTIERVNSAGNYEPDNCTWATHQAQNDNRPGWCFAVEINGEAMNLKQACTRFAAPGLTYRSVHKRWIMRGWPLGAALLLPRGQRAARLEGAR